MRAWKAIKRLWRLGTCNHRNAANWALVVPDIMVTGEFAELHFCRRCGRLLMAVRHADQPQHNQHVLRIDKLDDESEIQLPYNMALRGLSKAGKDYP